MIVSPKKIAFLFMLLIAVGGMITWLVKTITSGDGQVNTPGNEQAAPTEMKEVSAVKQPFKLVMSLNKTKYKIGELITIELKLINIGNSTVVLRFHSGGPNLWLRFKLFNVSGHLIFESWLYGWPIVTDVPLEPSSFIGYIHNWDQTFSQLVTPVRRLEPGTYRIVGFLDTLISPEITLETTPIDILIT